MNLQQIATNAEALKCKTVFVAYQAGRNATAQAIREASASREAGIRHDHYVGRVERIWRARNGDLIITIFAYNRGVNMEGKYRAFNPSLGTLRTFAVLD